MSFYSELILSDGPVGYWRLGEEPGSTVVIDEMNMYDGTYIYGSTGVLTLGVDGLLVADSDTALHLDSDGGTTGPYINLGTPLGSGTADNWTWELWTDVETLNVAACGVIGSGNNPRLQGSLDTGGWKAQFGAAWRDGSGWAGGPASGVIPLGSVAHVVLTVTGATSATPVAILYVNGVEHSRTNYSKAITSPSTLLLNYRDDRRGYVGTMDDASVYDRALTAEKIELHYEVGAYAAARETFIESSTLSPAAGEIINPSTHDWQTFMA